MTKQRRTFTKSSSAGLRAWCWTKTKALPKQPDPLGLLSQPCAAGLTSSSRGSVRLRIGPTALLTPEKTGAYCTPVGDLPLFVPTKWYSKVSVGSAEFVTFYFRPCTVKKITLLVRPHK